jgi:CubicO group peptidase (beta-lactamase class C family)
MPFESYLTEKVWKPAGMGAATWNRDRDGGSLKFFCCLNATSRDFLRFGKLFANQGRAGNIQVIPEEWVKEVIQGEAQFRDSQGYLYHLGWRQTPEGGIFAKGVLGQYIYIHPEDQMVIVRTGKSAKKLDWGRIFAGLREDLIRP